MSEKPQTSSKEEENRASVTRRSILGAAGAAAALSGLPAAASGQPSGEDFDPVEANSWEILQGYQAGTLTAEEVVKSYLDRIFEYENELGGVIRINSNALERARELDAEAQPGGADASIFETDDGTISAEARAPQQLVGPLHGIPVIIKDNCNTADMPTTSGAVALNDTTPTSDAKIVENIREAGGIVIAKANMDEFAFGYTSSSSMAGTAVNPYNTERTAGGSSGGTGNSMNASYGVIGIGTDTGGSVQVPSLANALCGIRPTTQLISGEGVSPLNSRQDVPGPIARTVADAALLLDVIAATDGNSTRTYQQYDNTPYRIGNRYTDYLNEDGLEDARIGIYNEWFPDRSERGDVAQLFDQALSDMRSEGATIVSQLETPPSDLVDNAYRSATTNFDWEEYLETIPGFDTVADIMSTGETESCGLTFAIGDPNTIDGLLEETNFANPYYFQNQLQQYILEQMEENNLDAIMFPGNVDVPSPDYSVGTWGPANNQLSPILDWPTITQPVGYTEDDVPVGMQLLGKRWSEPQLIELAYAYEQATGVREPPEDFGAVEETGVEWDSSTIEEWNDENRPVPDNTVDEPCDISPSQITIAEDPSLDTKNLPGGTASPQADVPETTTNQDEVSTNTTGEDTDTEENESDSTEEGSDNGNSDIDTGNLPE